MAPFKPKFVIGGLLSEAWARSTASYLRSMEYYNARVRDGVQPRTPLINLFDVQQQYTVLFFMNSMYLLITMGLFIFMKKRPQPFKLRWYLVLYDALNVILAAYIVFSTLKYKLSHGGLLLCNPIATDSEGYRIAKVFVLFYLQKYFEFIDTWFFILRKSSRQVTFLHLFHHSSITIVVGSILPFDYNGDMYLPIMLNSANHMLVYLHYLLATLGLQSWWAPYITSMQLGQFILIFAQSLLSYRVGPTCGSPDFAKVLMIAYMGSLVALFGNFFLQKYIFRRPTASLDMCGVIKRPQEAPSLACQHCGVLHLDATGSGIVLLPNDFPDPFTSPSGGAYLYTPFTVAYHLTALGAAMPNLHVSREVTVAPAAVSDRQDLDEKGGAQQTGCAPNVHSSQGRQQMNGGAGSSSGARVDDSGGGVDGPNGPRLSSDGSSSSTRPDTELLHAVASRSLPYTLAGAKAGDTVSIKRSPDSDSVLDSLLPHGSNRATLRRRERNDVSGPGRPSKGSLARSSSTGNLPSSSSSTWGNDESNRLHNDRLVDLPLPPLLGPGGLVEKYRKHFGDSLASPTGLKSTSGGSGYSFMFGSRSGSGDGEDGSTRARSLTDTDSWDRTGAGRAQATSSGRGPTENESHQIARSAPHVSAGVEGGVSSITSGDRNVLDSGKPPTSRSSYSYWGGGRTAENIATSQNFCFHIAGGFPCGKISWMIQTVPIKFSPKSGESKSNKLLLDDWRAIS